MSALINPNSSMAPEDYFRYGTNKSNWDYKRDQPSLAPEIRALMKAEKVDDRYRFVFMGACVLRSADRFSADPPVLGDRRACVFVRRPLGFANPQSSLITGEQVSRLVTPRMVDYLEPKNLFVRVMKTKFWYWVDSDGNDHRAPRPDELVAPKGAVVKPYCVLLELGHLVWELQYRLTGEQLVAGHFYHPADAPKEYWHTIKTFRSASHGYLAPTVSDVHTMILKREYDNRNLSPTEMREQIKQNALAEHRRWLAAKQATETAEKAGFDAESADVMAFALKNATNAGGIARVT